MARFCLIDFETASACDLNKAGAWRYAEDPTTEILCLGYTFGGDDRACRAAEHIRYGCIAPGMTRAYVLEDAVNDPECIFIAHNVAFEKAIWRKIMMLYGWPDIPNERWHDIMASCAMKGLPLKLERAAIALGLSNQKDTEGSHVTLSLSRYNKRGFLDRSPEKLTRVRNYNISDLDAELELHRRVRGLGRDERNVWLLDQRINERGVRLDVGFIGQAQKIVDDATKPLVKEFETVVGVRPTQIEKFKDWLIKEGCPFPRDEEGKLDTSLSKEAVAKILKSDPDEDDDSLAGDEDDWMEPDTQLKLPFRFERALRIRQVLGSASIKKLGAMCACICEDGRARGLLQYHGAGPGRWAGRLFQPQNFPRPSLKVDGEAPDQEHVISAIMTGDAEYVRMMFGGTADAPVSPIEVVSSSLRHALIASEGNRFTVGDFAKIECVIVLALAGATETAANVIKMGSAVYTDMATKIFGFSVNKKMLKEYTIGKNSVLGCGFQMGWRKFKLRYWQDGTEDQAKETIRIYREDFAPEVPKLWRALEDAAVATVWSGKAHMAYGIVYALEDGWLTARLPSGRKLWYRDPKPVRKAMPWDKTDIRPGFTYRAWKAGQWKIVNAYGGLLTENVVQAIARDLLVAGMFRLEANNFPLVLSVHDEAVSDGPAATADPIAFRQIMCDSPQWARALQIPVDADCWAGERYRK